MRVIDRINEALKRWGRNASDNINYYNRGKSTDKDSIAEKMQAASQEHTKTCKGRRMSYHYEYELGKFTPTWVVLRCNKGHTTRILL